jgi:hypothetical protein
MQNDACVNLYAFAYKLNVRSVYYMHLRIKSQLPPNSIPRVLYLHLLRSYNYHSIGIEALHVDFLFFNAGFELNLVG